MANVGVVQHNTGGSGPAITSHTLLGEKRWQNCPSWLLQGTGLGGAGHSGPLSGWRESASAAEEAV